MCGGIALHNIVFDVMSVRLLCAQGNPFLFPYPLYWIPSAALALNYSARTTRWSNAGTLLISFLKFSAIKQKWERWRKTHGQAEVTHTINSNTETGIEADANFSISSNPRQNDLKKATWRNTCLLLLRMPLAPCHLCCIYILLLLESPELIVKHKASALHLPLRQCFPRKHINYRANAH